MLFIPTSYSYSVAMEQRERAQPCSLFDYILYSHSLHQHWLGLALVVRATERAHVGQTDHASQEQFGEGIDGVVRTGFGYFFSYDLPTDIDSHCELHANITHILILDRVGTQHPPGLLLLLQGHAGSAYYSPKRPFQLPLPLGLGRCCSTPHVFHVPDVRVVVSVRAMDMRAGGGGARSGLGLMG